MTLYQTTVGSRAEQFESGAAGGFHLAGAFVRLSEDVPENIEEIVREALPDRGEDVTLTVSGISGGPAQGGLDVRVIGPDFNENHRCFSKARRTVKSARRNRKISAARCLKAKMRL